MRIIVVDNSLDITGAFKAVFNNIDNKGSRHEYFYYIPNTSNNKQVLTRKGIPVFTFRSYELSKKPKNLFLFLPYLFWNGYRLSRIIKKNKIDLVYQNEIFILSGLVAKFFCRVKVLTHIRVLPRIFPKRLYSLWLRLHDRFADKIVCVSFVCEQSARAVYNFKKKAEVFYDFVIPGEKLPPFAIRECKTSADIVFMGNYTKGKGQDLALEALSLLKKQHPGYLFKIRFYGSHFGYQPNIVYKNALSDYIKKNGLEELAFLFDFSNDIEAGLKKSDLLLNLSIAESFSFVVAEALSFGIPVIATNSGGPGELIGNKLSGSIVEADASAVAEEMYRLCTDVEQREKYSVNGKERIRSLIASYGGKEKFDRMFE